jgi:DNA modification methylase
MKERVDKVQDLPYQYSLFSIPNSCELEDTEPSVTPVSFREMVTEIPDTTYLTHGIFYYPAKFIPHVPYYCVRRFCPEGGWVLDPFAGSGTVGLEAVLAKRNAILIDINPLLSIYVDTKINYRYTDVDPASILSALQQMFNWEKSYKPDWKNLDYWYPFEMLVLLERYWGWVHSHNPHDPYVCIIRSALMKANRRFSWADHKAPKLFRSKHKVHEMQELLARSNWRAHVETFIRETALENGYRLRSLARSLSDNSCRVIALAGVDSTAVDLRDYPQTDAIITSPPYLQAQEYLRTFKLDLFWTGVSEAKVRELMRLEIPYRKAEKPFTTPTYIQVYNQLHRADLKAMLHSYFYHTTRALENAATTLKKGGFLCVFVGNPTVNGIEVETWRIIAEYFEPKGFIIYNVFRDDIKTRQLFRKRKNKNPRGMESEYLLVMRKCSVAKMGSDME